MSFEPKAAYRLVEETIPREDIVGLCDWMLDNDRGPAEIRKTPWLTQGPLVAEFEKAFAKQVGAAHAVFVNSGSSANLLAWFLPFESKNRRVVVPAVAWATSVMPAIQFCYEPVLCDADEETWGINPVELRRICENAEKGAPSVVCLVHVLGVPANMEEIAALKEEFGFMLIEDACGAFGSQPVGKIGELTTFSTYYGHQLSTIEGGFVCTDDGDLANIVRMLRAHGWANDLDADSRGKLAKAAKADAFREKFTFHVPGFNVRGTESQAHIGLSQLKRADAVTEARRANHGLYFSRFGGAKDFAVQTAADANSEIASIGFGVLAASQAHRTKIAKELAAKGIETRPVGGGNMARQPFWIAAYGESKRARPVADRIHDCGFQLPNHPGLTPEDIGFISDTVLAVRP